MAARKGLGALVFGGGSGLGLATAQRLVRNGYKVVVADLPSSEGDRVARDLGDSCIFASADVSAIGPFLSLPPHPSPNPPRIDETSGCVGTFDRWNISEGNEEKNPFFRKNGTFFLLPLKRSQNSSYTTLLLFVVRSGVGHGRGSNLVEQVSEGCL